MRWRLTGTVTYTDGIRRVWQTVPSLTQLLVQVDAAYPARHPADGTAAGQGHYLNSPKSDHTPDKVGDVRAGDIGEVVEDDAFVVAEAIRLSRDDRIKYVIHERRMYSSYNHPNGLPYEWRSYSGPNPHSSHVHISVYRINQTDNTPWDIGTQTPRGDDMETIKAIQKQCNAGGFKGANGLVLTVDGLLGPNTQHAMNALAVAATASGTQGSKGDPGPAGATGAKGDAGSKGATGAKGDAGAAGPSGKLTISGDVALP